MTEMKSGPTDSSIRNSGATELSPTIEEPAQEITPQTTRIKKFYPGVTRPVYILFEPEPPNR